MAKNQSRSMNRDLEMGSTEGTYKQIVRNQENIVYDSNRAKRRQLSWRYGIEEN